MGGSIGPTPDGGPLTFGIECRVRRNASRGKVHPVTIRPDWSVLTPHDLEAERIAQAFGGFTSCIELVDAVVPAVRQAAGILARRVPTPLSRTRDADGVVGHRVRWHVPVVRSCRCAVSSFADPQVAARHLRSASHLHRQHEVSRRALETVLRAVEEAWGPFDGLPAGHAEARRLVREPRGVEDLWEAGIHPGDLPAMASYAVGVEEPLPASYFLGVAYSGVDPAWLARTVARQPDPSVAEWLAWLTPTEGRVDDVGPWLELGLAQRQVLALTAQAVSVQAALDLAAGTPRNPRAAARDLAVWAEVGAVPDVAHFRLLDHHGLGSDYRPSARAIDRVAEIAGRIGAPVTRTELAVLLAIAGSVPAAERHLRRGARVAADLPAT